jgi:hypothetical protein
VLLLNANVELIRCQFCLPQAGGADGPRIGREIADNSRQAPGKYGEKVRRTIYKRAERLKPKRI